MPTYEFENTETGVVFERVLSIDAKANFLKNYPSIKQRITAPNVISGARVGTRKLGGFKEVLQKVGEAFPGSAVDRAHNTRTSKQVATDKVAKKHGVKDV